MPARPALGQIPRRRKTVDLSGRRQRLRPALCSCGASSSKSVVQLWDICGRAPRPPSCPRSFAGPSSPRSTATRSPSAARKLFSSLPV
eukprot:7050808-Alexandrium_andersonii.AAC.1